MLAIDLRFAYQTGMRYFVLGSLVLVLGTCAKKSPRKRQCAKQIVKLIKQFHQHRVANHKDPDSQKGIARMGKELDADLERHARMSCENPGKESTGEVRRQRRCVTKAKTLSALRSCQRLRFWTGPPLSCPADAKRLGPNVRPDQREVGDTWEVYCVRRGKRHGVAIVYEVHGSEDHVTTTYRDGARHGKYLSRRDALEYGLQIVSGAHRDGKRHGKWTMKATWGQTDVFYAAGVVHGKYVWERGLGRVEGMYTAGKRSGQWVFTYGHRSGRKAAEGSYEAGKPIGLWSFWGPDGKPIEKSDALREKWLAKALNVAEPPLEWDVLQE